MTCRLFVCAGRRPASSALSALLCALRSPAKRTSWGAPGTGGRHLGIACEFSRAPPAPSPCFQT